MASRSSETGLPSQPSPLHVPSSPLAQGVPQRGRPQSLPRSRPPQLNPLSVPFPPLAQGVPRRGRPQSFPRESGRHRAASNPRSFNEKPPVWAGDLYAHALDEADHEILLEFHNALEAEKLEECLRCRQCWFDMSLNRDSICKRCCTKDSKKRSDEPFFYSAENKLDFGHAYTSRHLPELTMVEEMLIARVHVAVNVLQVRGQQYKYRGHVVQFLRDVGKVYKTLPLIPPNLDIILLRPSSSERNSNHDAQFRKRFRVRRRHIEIWLEFLRLHHPGYRDFVWDRAALDQLPMDGDVLDQVNIEEIAGHQGHGLAQGPMPETDENDFDFDEFDASVLPNPALDQTEMEQLEANLDRTTNSRFIPLENENPAAAHHLSLPDIRLTPINEFDRSTALFSRAFPTLFPCGEAEFTLPRERSITLDEWIQHAMRWHDGRFARHPTFRFVAFNMLMRQKAHSASKYFVTKSSSVVRQISREELLDALKDPDKPEAQALLSSISRAAVNLKGTRPFWQRKRRELEAFCYCLLAAAAFITLSPADHHWRSLYQHMPRFAEWLAASEKDRMRLSRQLLRDNPHIAAWHFYSRNRLFREIVLHKRFGVSDFWSRFEFQGRGSTHSHGLYWFETSPKLERFCFDADGLDRIRFAEEWDGHVTAVNPEPLRRLDQDEGNPLTIRPQDHPPTFQLLSQIINKCQRHKCSETYCLRVNKKKAKEAKEKGLPEPPPECRFLFPHEACDKACMMKRPGKAWWSFLPRRNDQFLNQYNPVSILAWLANTDFSPCTSLQAVINYAAKYASKIETKSESFSTLTKQILPRVASGKPMLSFVTKLLNKLIGERDVSAQEVCHILLGLPLQEDSRVVRSVDCRPLEKQSRALRLSEDELFETSNSYQKYLERGSSKQEFATLTYHQFLALWNFSKNSPEDWRPYQNNAKARVLNYYPRYKGDPRSKEYADFCRVKLMLNHPHRSEDELLTFDGRQFESYETAYKHCQNLHTHPRDGYVVPLEPEEDELEFRLNPTEELDDEDWLEIARMLPNRGPTEEDLDLLGARDIDLQYDWNSHVGLYMHPNFSDGRYWKETLAGHSVSPAEFVPWEVRDTLNVQQRLVYDTVIGHSQQDNPEQLLLQIDGGGGTGKSYLIKILAAHLRQANREETVALAAPTGAASSNIRGKTIHSLLRLPVDNKFEQLSPTALAEAQHRLQHLKYMIIDEKSMLGLRTLGWISRRLSQIFPRSDQIFGGVNVILIGDFFQLPPVANKPLYTRNSRHLSDDELVGFSAYRAFTRSVFLSVVERQRGADQAAFRTALEELRKAQVSSASFELLSRRVAAVLSDQETALFKNALRIYATREEVRQYNYNHLSKLKAPVIQAEAIHTGQGAKNAPSEQTGNLSAKLPLCKGAKVMLLRNISAEMGLVNGSQGTVYDIGWAAGADVRNDPPLVVMVGFDDYDGPGFLDENREELRDSNDRKVIPILRVNQEFMLGSTQCSRAQFPLTISYAVTVHKAQGITTKRVVTNIAAREFASGLNYVACSRVTSLQGLMFEEPFDRNNVCKEPSESMYFTQAHFCVLY